MIHDHVQNTADLSFCFPFRHAFCLVIASKTYQLSRVARAAMLLTYDTHENTRVYHTRGKIFHLLHVLVTQAGADMLKTCICHIYIYIYYVY